MGGYDIYNQGLVAGRKNSSFYLGRPDYFSDLQLHCLVKFPRFVDGWLRSLSANYFNCLPRLLSACLHKGSKPVDGNLVDDRGLLFDSPCNGRRSWIEVRGVVSRPIENRR